MLQSKQKILRFFNCFDPPSVSGITCSTVRLTVAPHRKHSCGSTANSSSLRRRRALEEPRETLLVCARIRRLIGWGISFTGINPGIQRKDRTPSLAPARKQSLLPTCRIDQSADCWDCLDSHRYWPNNKTRNTRQSMTVE